MTVPLVVIVCAFEGLPTVAYAHQASYLLLYQAEKIVDCRMLTSVWRLVNKKIVDCRMGSGG